MSEEVKPVKEAKEAKEAKETKERKPKAVAKSAAPKEKSPATAATESVPATASVDPLAEEPKAKIIKAKGAKNIVTGVAHVLATFNNTIVAITDARGNVIAQSSAGAAGFKGSRKSTAYAAQMAAQECGRKAMSHGMKEVEVWVKGPGLGRESAVRSLQAIGLEITAVRDVTPVPHNGCRPRKPRRV